MRIRLTPPDQQKILEVEKHDGSILVLKLKRVTVEERLKIENDSLSDIKALRDGGISGTEFNLKFLETWVEGFKREFVNGFASEHLNEIMKAISDILNPTQTVEQKKNPDGINTGS